MLRFFRRVSSLIKATLSTLKVIKDLQTEPGSERRFSLCLSDSSQVFDSLWFLLFQQKHKEKPLRRTWMLLIPALQ